MGDSEALDATVRSGKMRSTMWERSQSLGSSKNNENIRNTKGNTLWNVLGHCFVMNEVFLGFQKHSMPRFDAEKSDLQFGSGPGASGAQKIMKI